MFLSPLFCALAGVGDAFLGQRLEDPGLARLAFHAVAARRELWLAEMAKSEPSSRRYLEHVRELQACERGLY